MRAVLRMKKEQQARVIQEHAETIKQRRGSGPSAEKDILGFLDGTGAPNKVELKIVCAYDNV
jgi:hypothetical protein